MTNAFSSILCGDVIHFNFVIEWVLSIDSSIFFSFVVIWGAETHAQLQTAAMFELKCSCTSKHNLKIRIFAASLRFIRFIHDFWFFSRVLHRHVMLPKELVRLVPKAHLMSESEWRAIGVQQSRGWVHYMIHTPEPHILLFRRPITKE